MYNYTIQFRYNQKEDSIPIQSEIELKTSDHPLSLHTKIYPCVMQYLDGKHLWNGHEFMEVLRLYGKGGELIYDMKELDSNSK